MNDTGINITSRQVKVNYFVKIVLPIGTELNLVDGTYICVYVPSISRNKLSVPITTKQTRLSVQSTKDMIEFEIRMD